MAVPTVAGWLCRRHFRFMRKIVAPGRHVATNSYFLSHILYIQLIHIQNIFTSPCALCSLLCLCPRPFVNAWCDIYIPYMKCERHGTLETVMELIKLPLKICIHIQFDDARDATCLYMNRNEWMNVNVCPACVCPTTAIPHRSSTVVHFALTMLAYICCCVRGQIQLATGQNPMQ